MRITCPTCNAHYEIGEELIQPEGRDVQCSNCGTTWFQKGRAGPAPAADDTGGPAKTPDVEEADDVARTLDDDAPEAPPEPEPEPEPAGRRPAADKAALDILREERAREDRLRAGIEANPPAAGSNVGDMPSRDGDVEDDGKGRDDGSRVPDAPARDPREAAAAERVRMAAAATRARARIGGRANPRETVDIPAGKARERTGAGPTTGAEVRDDGFGASSPAIAAAAGRRGRITGRALLPDIEEINSSLRPDNSFRADAEGAAPNREAGAPPRAGFRLGFLAVCAAALALAALYAFAEPLVRGVPALAEPMARYVDWVDLRRSELEAAVEALTVRIAPES